MPTINGRDFQHATIDIDVSINGALGSFTFDKFTKVAYKFTAEKKPVLDKQGQIVGYTIDNSKTEGSMTTLLSEWVAFLDFCNTATAGTIGVGQLELNASISYGDTLDTLRKDEVEFMFQEDPRTSESNQDALYVDLPWFVRDINPDEGKFIQYA